MIPNPLFWADYIQNLFIPQIRTLGQAFDDRIMPAFQGIEEEADRIQNKKWDELCKRAGPDTDHGDMAEAARDAGLEYYETIKSLQQGINNLFAAAFYHMFEQQLLMIHRKDLLSEEEKDNENLFNFGKVVEKLTNYGINIKIFQAWPKLEELQLVANVVKHADGTSSSKLKDMRPDMFRSPDPVVREIWGECPQSPREVFQPLFGEDFYVTPEDLRLYVKKVVELWEEFADVLEKQ